MVAACSCTTAPALPKKIERPLLEKLVGKTKLKSTEVKALYRRFRLLCGRNEYLKPDQFRQTMGVLGLTDDPFIPDRMFRVFDADQDGCLSFEEFATSLAVMIRGTEDEKLKLSFEMTAGRHGSRGILFEDFRHLIRACNTMMQSLVTPDTRPVPEEHIRRMFRDLSSDGESDDEPVITIDDYKAAAQSNDDFLVCLGLTTPYFSKRDRGRTMTYDSNATRKRTMSNSPGASLPPMQADRANGESQYMISTSQLDELRDRVMALRDVVLQDRTGAAGPLIENSAATPSVASTPSNVEDPDERWWTPLPKRNGRNQRASRAGHVTLEVPRSIDDIAGEFDKVLDWIAAGTGENRFGSGSSAGSGFKISLDGTDGEMADTKPHTPNYRSGASDRGEDHIFFSPYDSARTQGSAGTGSVGVEGHAQVIRDRSNTHHTTRTLISGDRSSSQTMGMQGSTGTNRTNTASRRKKRLRLLGPKKGLAVHFGHENWNMVLSMMIGIRMSVGRIKHEMSRELTPVDFIMKEKFSIIPRMANIFDSEVSKRVTMTRFIDYAPMVFQRIRSSFGIHQDDYLRSVGPEQLLGNMVLGNLSSLSELSSEGKSGAFFYYTADGKYMMKTVTPKEHQLLKRMLKKYYDHIMKNKSTLICRFLGLHCLRVRKYRKGAKTLVSSDRKLYFVVMGNMFNTPFEIHRRYDLKGSWVGRETPPDRFDPSVALKDVDFKQANESIRVGKELKDLLVQQIIEDSAFLRDNNVIDYSLLLGIHDIGSNHQATVSLDPAELDNVSEAGQDGGQAHSNAREGDGLRPDLSRSITGNTMHSYPQSPISNSNFQAEAGRELPVHQRDLGGLLSSDKRQLYFFGIIDILTPYDTRKRTEHHLKALRYDRRGVSCCPPVFYAERFNDFLKTAFV